MNYKFFISKYKWLVVFAGFLVAFLVYRYLSTRKKDSASIANILTAQGCTPDQLAGILYDAMNPVGTNLDAINAVFECIGSQAEYDLIARAFGKRRYFLCGGAAFLGFKYDLGQWLRAELSGKNLSKWLPYINNSSAVFV